MFLAVVKAYFGRVNVTAAVEAVHHHLGALALILQVGGVDPHEKIPGRGKFHLFFKNRHFVFCIFVQADFTHTQDRGLIQKFGYKGDHFPGKA